MTQYSLKAGLKLHGVRAEKVVGKELQQIHDMDTFHPIKPEDMTRKQRAELVSSLMILKEKRDSTMKGRVCVVGSSQRRHIDKVDAASPTTHTESVFITQAISAKEGRNNMVIDVDGAFLTTDSDEDVIMELKGPLAELMCKINPSLYRKFITTNSKGQAILYVKIHKALYGLMRSALLFYRRMVKELESYGFKLNPYDPCVANMDVNGEQMAICWHVDDLLCTHKSNFELTKLALYLKEQFGGISVA